MTTTRMLEQLRHHFKRKITRRMLYQKIDDGRIKRPLKNESGAYEWHDYHFNDCVAALRKNGEK